MIYMFRHATQDEYEDQFEAFKPALSIARLIQFNAAQIKFNSNHLRYSSAKETPSSIYIAFHMY